MSRAIPLVFATREAFRAALAEHLDKGGAVVEVDPRPALQARVVVALELAFCKQRILLDADVVQETPGGVAVQFLEPAEALRERLLGWADGTPPARPARRAAPADVETDDPFGDGDLFGGTGGDGDLLDDAISEDALSAEAQPPATRRGDGLDHAEVELDPSDEPIPELGTPGTGHAEPHLD